MRYSRKLIRFPPAGRASRSLAGALFAGLRAVKLARLRFESLEVAEAESLAIRRFVEKAREGGNAR